MKSISVVRTITNSAPENGSLGTDHGAANPMFVAETRVKGGHNGKIPSLTKLDEGDNLAYTTDFRRVYATMVAGSDTATQKAC